MQVTQRNYPAGHGRLKTILARRLEKKEVCADYRSYESQPWTEMIYNIERSQKLPVASAASTFLSCAAHMESLGLAAT